MSGTTIEVRVKGSELGYSTTISYVLEVKHAH